MRGAFPLLIGFALAVVLQLAIGPFVGPFAVKLLMDIGINIVLAVSLNLVNGFTGQFSIGHAGFMAVGGYVAGAITYYGSFLLWGSAKVQPGWLSGPWFWTILLSALIVVLCLFALGVFSPETKGEYVPPHLENGTVVPGKVDR